MFSSPSKTKIIIIAESISPSANALNLDQSRILLFGKEIKEVWCILDSRQKGTVTYMISSITELTPWLKQRNASDPLLLHLCKIEKICQPESYKENLLHMIVMFKECATFGRKNGLNLSL